MRIGLIGAGNIAGAIVSGISGSGLYSGGDIFVYDVDKAKASALAEKYGANACESPVELMNSAEIIALAVKPQNYADALTQIKDSVRSGQVFISIGAGIESAYVKGFLGENAHVVRIMPNTALLVGEGATAMSRDENVTDEEFNECRRILESAGSTAVLPESLMAEVISVNGSSPAYVFLLAKAVCDCAEKQGIERETAKALFAQTLRGAATMIEKSGMELQALIDMVTSPGGTTAKALEQLYAHDFCAAVDDAMLACTKRAKELGK